MSKKANIKSVEKTPEEIEGIILAKWKAKGTVEDEEKAKEYIRCMLWLVDSYIFTHLIITLCEIKDEYDKYYN